jgi:ABC transporter substrate binding protein
MDINRHSSNTVTAIRLVRLITLIVLSIVWPVAIHAESTASVYVITTPGSDYQIRVSDTLIDILSINGIETTNIPASNLEQLKPAPNAVFITFGGSTSSKVTQLYSEFPQLNLSYDIAKVEKPAAHDYASLLLNQPACRQVYLIRKLAPAWKTIGIITNRSSSKQIDDIRQCVARNGLVLHTYSVKNNKELMQKLDIAVNQNDVLLALADTVVYNSHSVKNVLLTAYRHRKPVIGYTNSLVKAGAVAAIYTSAEDAGKQAAEIIQEYISSNGCFSRSVYTPSAYTVSINSQVARALDIELGENANFSDDLDLHEMR